MSSSSKLHVFHPISPTIPVSKTLTGKYKIFNYKSEYIIYNFSLRSWRARMGDADWIGLAQDRDKWRTLVNAFIISFRFHKILGNYQAYTQLVASQIEPSSIVRLV
jgi:hypothetical protein